MKLSRRRKTEEISPSTTSAVVSSSKVKIDHYQVYHDLSWSYELEMATQPPPIIKQTSSSAAKRLSYRLKRKLFNHSKAISQASVAVRSPSPEVKCSTIVSTTQFDL